MKRVLIITYYWPPSGGSGVQRWLKYSKYLPEYGWQPVIYTPENPEAPASDESLLSEIPEEIEIIKRPILEPYGWYKWITGRKESVNVGFTRTEADSPESRLERLSRWIRGNFFIPDARKFWIRPSVRFLSDYLKNNPVDAIISTGPPHSMHLIAMRLARHTKLPWLADFRDPWTGIDFYDELFLTKQADRRHRKLEKTVLETASSVITVSDQIRHELASKGAGTEKVMIVPNGFDPADFENTKSTEPTPDAFTLVHTGSLVPSRNPEVLWKALGRMCSQNPAFSEKLRIKLIGSSDGSVIQSLRKYNLYERAEIIPYLPHADAIRESLSASVLLLLINNTPNAEGFLSGKVFEYLAMGKPVLCIGPEKGDAARLLNETGAGKTAGFNDDKRAERILTSWFDAMQQGQKPLSPYTSAISRYSRKEQAGSIAKILDGLSVS